MPSYTISIFYYLFTIILFSYEWVYVGYYVVYLYFCFLDTYSLLFSDISFHKNWKHAISQNKFSNDIYTI